jgi:two-component system, sensor histidine kinase LadS
MNGLHIKLILGFALSFMPLSAYSITPIKIDDGLTQKNITGSTFYIEDSARSLQIKTVSDFLQMSYQKANDPQENFGHTSSYYWFLIPVQNKTKHVVHVILELDNPHIPYLQFYRSDAKGAFHGCGITGDYSNPFKDRTILYRNFSQQLNLQPGETTYCMLFIDKSYQQLSVLLNLYDGSTFFDFASKTYIMLGLYAGAFLCIFLFNLIMFFFTGKWLNFLYSGFVFFAGLYILSDWGLGFQYVWPNFPMMNAIARPVFSMCMLLFMTLCLNYFLKDKAHYKGWIRAILGLSLLLILSAIITRGYGLDRTLIQPYLKVHATIMLFSVGILICILVLESIKGNKVIQVLLLAYALFLTFGLTKQLIVSGIIQGSDFMDKALILGHIIEFFAVTVLLSIYYEKLKSQNDLLQWKILDQNRKHLTEVITIQESERKRIAEDLHDELGGSLSAIRVNLSAWAHRHPKEEAELKPVENLVDNACEQVRAIAHHLMPPELVILGFTKALENLVIRMNKSDGPAITIQNDLGEFHFEPSTEIALYRVLNEILTNILRHSQAKNASLQVFKSDGRLFVIAEDDGIGFDTKDQVNGIGLVNIRSRVQALGGTLNIDSSPGNGTTIIIDIPFIGD